MAERMLTPHFGKSEMVCKCCGRIGGYPAQLRKLMDKLEDLRLKAGCPIHITCGYRCPKHNAETPGADPNSPHTRTQAADIYADNLSVDELANIAEQIGFSGIGRYYRDQFVHVDIQEPRSRWHQTAAGRVIYTE